MSTLQELRKKQYQQEKQELKDKLKALKQDELVSILSRISELTTGNSFTRDQHIDILGGVVEKLEMALGENYRDLPINERCHKIIEFFTNLANESK